MADRDIEVTFEAEYPITIAEPFDYEAVHQMLQDELGFTGLIVTEVFVADGASDL